MATLLTGTGTQAMSQAGSIFAIGGSITGTIGAYYSAQAQKDALQAQAAQMRFQRELSQLNAVQAEFSAQQIMRAGQQKQAQIGLRAGKIKSSQRASLAARGITLGVGNAAETIATTDIMKEIDMLTVNAETVRSAEATRMQRQNFMNQATMQEMSALNLETSAGTISPFGSAFTTMLGSAGSVANAWYQDRKLAAMAAKLGIE
jgi:hypothetical protein